MEDRNNQFSDYMDRIDRALNRILEDIFASSHMTPIGAGEAHFEFSDEEWKQFQRDAREAK